MVNVARTILENERAQELYYRLGYENLNYLQMIKRLDEENA